MQPRSKPCTALQNGKLCDNPSCTPCTRAKSLFKVKDLLKSEDFEGSAPGMFVGHYGYPYLNVGFLSPPEIKEDAWLHDAPKYWANHNYQIPNIVDLRTQLINSRFKAQVKGSNKFLDIGQEVGMASKPVDMEINLNKKPTFRIQTDAVNKVMGPNASLKQAKLTQNPSIHTKVDKVVDDTDLKATEAITYLYKHNFDENFLTGLLSIGDLGLKHNRKLVPTKWSITATDGMLGTHLLKEVKDFKFIDYKAYVGDYLGNYFLILTFPEIYQYELFEMFAGSHPLHCTTDFEPYEGRKSYVEQTAGGFYATRIAVLEQLKKEKRQGSVLVLRFITEDYGIPLGVFVVREAVRKTMANKPITFTNKELLITYAKHLAKRKFRINLDELLPKSILMKNISQPKLTNFM